MDNLQNLPEAQRIDYAPAQPKKRFPWMLLCAAPFVALGVGITLGTMLVMARVHEDPAVFAGFGVGFLTLRPPAMEVAFLDLTTKEHCTDMKVLIIGGTGLISTPITRTLIARGDEVTLYNRGQRSQEFAGKVKEIHGDRRDFATFEKQMQDAGAFDVVIDMICFRPDEAESDVRAFAGRCGQFIFCSTVDVYARPSFALPYREGTPLHSLSDYGRNKVLCERIFEKAHHDRQLNITILRPAHTYSDSGAIIHSLGWSSSLLDRMRKGKPIIIHGDGQSLWVSAHAEDVATGFVGAMGNLKAYGRGYHLPGEEWISWNTYHQVVVDILGVKLPEVIHIPTDLLAKIAPRHAGVCGPNFQYTNIFDTTQAREDLGYRYAIPVKHGFARVVNWLDAHNAVADCDKEPYYDQIIAAWRDLAAKMEAQIVPLGV